MKPSCSEAPEPLVVRHDNNFNLLRMLAAEGVLISHCFPLASGKGTPEPLQHILGFSLGHVAVLIFFGISGYFISQSYDRSRSILQFSLARVLRIYPALVVALIYSIFVCGLTSTVLAPTSYLLSPETAQYFFRALTLKFIQEGLPGVFLENPFPVAVNGSLWTLFYEVSCYGLAVVFAIAVGDSRRRATTFLLSLALVYIGLRFTAFGLDVSSRHGVVMHFLELAPAFCLGMALYHFRIPLSWIGVVCLSMIAAAAYSTSIFREIFLVSLIYTVFVIGFSASRILRPYNRLGDYSYGTYIYAFPTQQMIASHFAPLSPALMFLLSAPTVLLLSVLSWHSVEQQSISLRKRLKPPKLRSKKDSKTPAVE